MTGYCFDPALHPLLTASRTEVSIANGTEEFCRALWDLIVARLDEWKWRHGAPPDRSQAFGLLAANQWRDVSDDDVPAFAWTGQPFDSYAALIRRLLDEKYEPIVEIAAKVSGGLLWAVIALAEAASRNSSGAVLAYSYLEMARQQELLDHNAEILADMKAIAPLLKRSARFLHGRRPGAIDGLSRLLDRLLAADPDVSTMDAWRRLPEFAPDEIMELDPDTLEWSRSGSRSIRVSLSSGAFDGRMSKARKRLRDK